MCPGTVSSVREEIPEIKIPDISTEDIAELEDDPVEAALALMVN